MDRAEHLAWAKERAHLEVNAGNITGGIASMASDLGKHDGFDKELILFMVQDAMLFLINRSDPAKEINNWIDGFN
jgi:hypothetical protein